jgi:hypothetical protein
MVTKCTDDVRHLIEIYGPILGGIELRTALGFKSVSAFNRAIALGRVSVPFFAMEGRRGRFARTSAVAEWISAAEERGWPLQVRQSSRALQTPEKAYPRKSKETARTRSATQGKKPTRKKEGAKM